MGEETKIQWCDHTLNVWIGCTKVAAECENCYASVNTFTRFQRSKGRELWGPRGARHIVADATVNKVYAWNKAAIAAGDRRRVFCSSLSDVLEDRRDLDAPRARLWRMVEECQGLDFLLLTKRPANFATLTPESWRTGAWPANAWAGTSAGCRKTAADAVPKLLAAAVPAPVRFVSYEPALEAVDFAPWLSGQTRLDWIIIGGESGPRSRPFDLAWGRTVLAQCRAAGSSPFFKQTGEQPRGPENELVQIHDRKGGVLDELPPDLRVREWPVTPLSMPRQAALAV